MVLNAPLILGGSMEFQLIDIEDIINSPEMFLAHIDGKMEVKENLKTHMERSIKYFEKLNCEKNMLNIIKKVIGNFEIKGEKIDSSIADKILDMFVNAIWLHDLGKINPAFQNRKLNNNNVDYNNNSEANNTEHSILSALIFIDIFNDRIDEYKDMKTKNFLRTFIYYFSYVISRHHTYLDNVEIKDYCYELKQAHKRFTSSNYYLKHYKYADRIKKLSIDKLNNREKKEYDGFDMYILTKLLYSCIVACDFYATYFYMNGNDIEFNYIKDIEEMIDKFKKDYVTKGIEEYRKDKEYFGETSINRLRSEMFIESEQVLEDELDKNIFYLEAPTGSGKTITSINLALNIMEKKPEYNKVFYVFPFNTLIEQTKNTFDRIFEEEFQKRNKIAVINSVTPVITEGEETRKEEYIDYNKCFIDRQFIHYPVVITSHVNFFNYLFGTGREINLPLIHLCNSVVILDEIQSYKNTIWPEITRFLDKYSRLLNIKIIIMSATLPKLDSLLKKFTDVDDCSIKLIKDRDKFFKSRFFKDRVKINYELLKLGKIDETILLDNVTRTLKDRKYRVLIEFIKKKSAESFYRKIKEAFPNKKVFLLTGDDNKFTRNKVLNELNSRDENSKFIMKDVILVATQVIEAGVDIDMDIGFKDISILDNEEQFLGRLNRSCSRDGVVAYFFNMDNAAKVYGGDLRLEKDLLQEEYQQYLEDKDFGEFYELCFTRLYEKKNEANANSINGLYINLKALNFKEIQERMKLIDNKNYELYIPYVYQDGDITIDGRNVWSRYRYLLNNKDMNYSERMIKLSQVISEMQLFLFNSIKKPSHYSENIGDIYYVENGDDYITEDYRFNREEYEKSYEGDIF